MVAGDFQKETGTGSAGHKQKYKSCNAIKWFHPPPFLLSPLYLRLNFSVVFFPCQSVGQSVGLHLLQDSDGHVMDLAATIVEVVASGLVYLLGPNISQVVREAIP